MQHSRSGQRKLRGFVAWQIRNVEMYRRLRHLSILTSNRDGIETYSNKQTIYLNKLKTWRKNIGDFASSEIKV